MLNAILMSHKKPGMFQNMNHGHQKQDSDNGTRNKTPVIIIKKLNAITTVVSISDTETNTFFPEVPMLTKVSNNIILNFNFSD